MTGFYEAPSAAEVVITWLSELGEVGPERPAGSALPFRWVNVVAGSDDKVTERLIVSVHTFASTFEAAEVEARRTHQRMLALGPPLAPQQTVTLFDGSTARADSVSTSQSPIWSDYGDNTINRFVARYTVELRMNRAAVADGS